MNDKDVASANTISDQHIVSDSPIVISDDSSSRSTALRPKQLFPGNSNQSNHNSGHTTLNLTTYDYQSPMEKHLSHLFIQISDKNIEIEKIKSEIDCMKPPEESLADNVAITCSKCHMGNHTRRWCVDSPCTTSISCGKIRFHKAELKAMDTKKGTLKKLIRDKVSLESECKKVCETIAATVKTFPQAIKTALINSNWKEYLTVHDGKFVPLTTKINWDITILQKYYNGKIPSDIEQESSLFPAIIAEANKRLSVKLFTIEQKLEETLSSVHRCITSKHTCSWDTITLDSSPELETTHISHIEFSPPTSMAHVTSASPLNTSSNLIICSHLHSPPNKVAKPSSYCRSKVSIRHNGE